MNRRIAKKILNENNRYKPRYWEKSQYGWDGKYELFYSRAYKKAPWNHPAAPYRQTMRLCNKMENWCKSGNTPTSQDWKSFFEGWNALDKIISKKHTFKDSHMTVQELASIPKSVFVNWENIKKINRTQTDFPDIPVLEELPLLWQCIISDLYYYSDRWCYSRLERMRVFVALAKQLLGMF